MGTYYTLHCEAKIKDEWRNIDLYYKDADGNFKIIPLVEGKSYVGAVINWYDMTNQKIDGKELASDTLAAHPTSYPEHQTWYAFDYRDFFGHCDFEVPEYSGYMSRSVMNLFRAENDYDYLESAVDTNAFLTPAEFAKLTPEAQRGFEFFEFTVPFGMHDVMRTIQRGVKDRLVYADGEDGPVRIIILVW